MECTVCWHGEGMSFIAETESKHLVAMDGAPDGGGRNLAPRPMEMVLAGTGGCTAYDVILILKPGLVENAIRLSREKYCSASNMLDKTAAITTGFEIVEAGAQFSRADRGA